MRRRSSNEHQTTGRGIASRLTDLQSCLVYLEKTGKLSRVKSPIDSRHELAGIAKSFEGGKSLLFEKVKGSPYPVFVGMLWNRDTVAGLFGAPKEEVPFILAKAIGAWQEKGTAWPSPVLSRGPANEVIEKGVDLYGLPISVHALKDGGRYLDASVMVAKNPMTGIPNLSIHRMMVTHKDRLTFPIDPERHLNAYLALMEKRNEPLPVTINIGVGLLPWLVSAIPQQGDGKHEIASRIIGRPIKFIQAQTVDVPAFADAQFVIEAEILPRLREKEGPFAEVTGYYSSIDDQWVMKAKAVTRRKAPIFHTLLSGQEVWNAIGFTAEAKIFATVKRKIPQLERVFLTPGGCGFYGAVVQVKKDQDGVGKEAILETFKAFSPLQRVVAVDSDVDPHDPIDVDWAITTRFNPDQDLIILKNQPGNLLNPMVRIRKNGKGGTITKIGLDATAPYPRTRRFERVRFKRINLKQFEIEY